VGDRILMLENTWYSVISPESCSSILWRSWEHKQTAAEALKLTAKDMKRLKIVDQIVKEPLGGAHADLEKNFKTVSGAITKTFNELKKLSAEDLVEQRMNKYVSLGVYKD
jgi:acetyl-CoA carboxylase carboxyl transferase subunit alpha